MIQTGRLTLKPRTIGWDIEKEIDWLNDPEVVKFSEQRHRKHTIESQIAYICSFGGNNLLFDIRRGGLLIGSISAIVDRNNGVANLGILIGDKLLWGQGYGLEAWSAFSDHLFQHHRIRKIEAGCMATNVGMLNLAAKAQMFLEGQKIGHFKTENGTVDLMEYGKFA